MDWPHEARDSDARGRFSADRMVLDYVRECYIPAAGGRSCDVKN
jgi:hypothetical protein